MIETIEQIHADAVRRLRHEKLKPEVQLLKAICAEVETIQRSRRLILTFQEMLDAMEVKGRELLREQELRHACQQLRQNLSLQ